MKGDKRATSKTVADALKFVATTNGPAIVSLRSGLQASQMAATFKKYPKGYIIFEYRDDNPDMGLLVQRLFFDTGKGERRLATSGERNSWNFSYPD